MNRNRITVASIAFLGVLSALAWSNLQPQAYGAVRSKVFHTLSTCSSGKRIKTRVEFTKVADAEKAGRHLCAECGRKRK